MYILSVNVIVATGKHNRQNLEGVMMDVPAVCICVNTLYSIITYNK